MGVLGRGPETWGNVRVLRAQGPHLLLGLPQSPAGPVPGGGTCRWGAWA